MKKYFSETVTLNGTTTLLHTVEMPRNGKLNMDLNKLGYFEDSSGELYYPVNALVHTFIGRGNLRELTWHALRNIQRNLNDENALFSIEKTRRLQQLHEALPTYKANGVDTFAISGILVDKEDLLLVFKEAADWYIWESDQPDQWFRSGWLLHFAVIALYAHFDIRGLPCSGLANKVAAKINANHLDDPVPVYQIQCVMDQMTIPACCDELAENHSK